MDFHKAQKDGENPGLDELTKRLGDLWYGDVKAQEILYSRSLQKKIPAATEAISWFAAYLRNRKRRPSIIIDVDVPFTLKVGDHKVSGRIDLVEEVQTPRGPKLELGVFSLAKMRPTEFYIRTHLDITLQTYAFRSLYKATEDQISVWWIRGGDRIETHRTPVDFKRLRAQIRQAAWWLNDYPTPRYGIHCNSCPFQEECLDWDDEGGEDS